MRECACICVSVHPQVRVSCVFTNFPAGDRALKENELLY